MKKSKFILPIVLAFASTQLTSVGPDDLAKPHPRSCLKSQPSEDKPKRSIQIVEPNGRVFPAVGKVDEVDFETLKLRQLNPENITKRLQARARLLTQLEVPDSEWEFGLSTLSYVLGLSNETTERHEHWAINSYREINLLLNALEIYFQTPDIYQTAEFATKYWEYRTRVEGQMRLTHYYSYLAAQLIFDDHMEMDKPFLDATERSPLISSKRRTLPTEIFHELTSRSDESDRLLRKIIREGGLGDSEKRASLLDHLRDCYLKSASPKALFAGLTDNEKFILSRFVIAMKERLLRFITPEEESLIKLYEETFGKDFSSESDSDFDSEDMFSDSFSEFAV